MGGGGVSVDSGCEVIVIAVDVNGYCENEKQKSGGGAGVWPGV